MRARLHLIHLSTTLDYYNPITNKETVISTHTPTTSQTTVTGPTLDDRDLTTTVKKVFHISDSQVAIIISAASLIMFIVLAIVLVVQILYGQKTATKEIVEKLMKKDSMVDDLPTSSFHTYNSPIFNPHIKEEKLKGLRDVENISI